MNLRLIEGIHLTDPNASDLTNFIIGAFDVLIVILAISGFFYFRNPKVKAKRLQKQETRNEKYRIRRAARLASGKKQSKFAVKYQAMPNNHYLKRLVRFLSFSGNIAINIAIVVGFIILVIVLIMIAVHNGSCVGPDGDYSTCYP